MTDVTDTTATKATFDLSASGAFGTYSGEIETIGDHDWIKVTLTAGLTYNFYSSMHSSGSYRGDTQLSLMNAFGTQLLTSDDNGGGYDSHIVYTPGTSGTFYLNLGEHGDDNHGEYTIVMDHGPGTDVYLDDTANSYAASTNGERVEAVAGDDIISLGAVGYDAFGQTGNDIIYGNASSNYISGGADNDSIQGADGVDLLFGDGGADIVYGGANGDEVHGGSGDDDLFGDAGDDMVAGGSGNDFIFGGSGLDVLIGGAGTDRLTGGTEADTFVFKSVKDSAVGGGRDSILDFAHGEGDKIDLHAIDANSKHAGNNAFHWIGSAGFHHKAGELHFHSHVLSGDVNGDGKADFEIHVNTGLSSQDIIV